jgi:hypothetical protein
VAKTTKSYKRLQLTLPQLNAIDALVAGKSDMEVAGIVGVHRVTVSKWRLYDPYFQAELNARRRALWGDAAERLRALLPKAIDTLEAELSGDKRLAAALQVIRLTGLNENRFEPGGTDASAIIESRVGERADEIFEKRLMVLTESERQMARLTAGRTPNDLAVAREQVMAEIEAAALEADQASPTPNIAQGGGDAIA